MFDFKKIEAAVSQISAEKKIDREKLIDIIESAIKVAYKKSRGSKDMNVNVHVDVETGRVEINVEKEIVDEVENPQTQISLAEVQEAGLEGFSIGDTVYLEDNEFSSGDEEFGRIASQAARQVIIQKIQETEKEKIYNLFKNKEGTIVSLKIELVEKNKVFLDYNGNTVILPKSEQSSRDVYSPGSRLYVYVGKVENELAGHKVVLTRKDKGLVTRLFEMNVPELEEGTVEIVSVARIPGFKTKIIVASSYEEVDPAGSLIGPKGIRVKAVVDELFGEKIDIINYNNDMREIIKKALTPGEILDVKINEADKVATCYLLEEEKGKALGKGGNNLHLAAELTGYEIVLETATK